VALAAGAGGWPELQYEGFNNVNSVLLDADLYPATRLCGLLVGKILLTATCLGSGLVGGVFAPSLFMGAVGGALFGQAASGAAGALGLAISPATDYAAVGGAAVLAAVCNVPLTAVVLLLELSQGTTYAICLPLIAAVSISVYVEAYLQGGLKGLALRDASRNALSRVSMLEPQAAADAERIFAELDKNKDGAVSSEEFKEWFSTLGDDARDAVRVPKPGGE